MAGESPARFRDRLLLERAAHLVATTDRPLQVIAAECGFRGYDVFSRAFRRELGALPSQWRADPTSWAIDAPGDVHFHAPLSVRLPARSRVDSVDLVVEMVEHHVHVVGTLLERAGQVSDVELDRPSGAASLRSALTGTCFCRRRVTLQLFGVSLVLLGSSSATLVRAWLTSRYAAPAVRARSRRGRAFTLTCAVTAPRRRRSCCGALLVSSASSRWPPRRAGPSRAGPTGGPGVSCGGRLPLALPATPGSPPRRGGRRPRSSGASSSRSAPPSSSTSSSRWPWCRSSAQLPGSPSRSPAAAALGAAGRPARPAGAAAPPSAPCWPCSPASAYALAMARGVTCRPLASVDGGPGPRPAQVVIGVAVVSLGCSPTCAGDRLSSFGARLLRRRHLSALRQPPRIRQPRAGATAATKFSLPAPPRSRSRRT